MCIIYNYISGVNIAGNKSAVMLSSAIMDNGAPCDANMALDGDTTPYFSYGSCSCTQVGYSQVAPFEIRDLAWISIGCFGYVFC